MMPPQAFVVIYVQENFMKKLLVLLISVLMLVLPLTSCTTADDIGTNADNAASTLEFNFYNTLKITTTKTIPNSLKEVKEAIKEKIDVYTVIEKKDSKGELLDSVTVYSCKSEEDAKLVYELILPYVSKELEKGQILEISGGSKVIFGKSANLVDVTMPEGVEEMVVAEKCDKNGSVEDKITIYFCDNSSVANGLYASLSENAGGLDVGISSSKIYIGTEDALVDATQKNWFNQLYHTFIEDENYMYVVKGFGNTIIITLGALLIGVILGVLIAVAKYYSDGNPKLKAVNFLCDLYTTVIRGIPITVLLLIFFFIILISTDGIIVAIIAFGINSGAYMAELVRSGINAVDKGQMEAARSLGLTKWQAMRTVIFPQAIKNILPAIGNECIALLKETSVAGYVAVVDLTRGANLIRNNTYDAFNPLILSAIIYLTLVIAMTKLLSVFERRLQKSDKH